MFFNEIKSLSKFIYFFISVPDEYNYVISFMVYASFHRNLENIAKSLNQMCWALVIRIYMEV